MMSTKRLAVIRVMVIVILVLLALQFEFGMAVNLSTLPDNPAIGFSLNGVNASLHQAGVVTVIHASLGSLLVLFSILSLIFSLRTGIRSVQVFASLAFISTFLAAFTGVLFVLSGYKNDGVSHGMATNFLLSYTFFFIELYFLKPAPKVGGK
jgi:hypothetical protein